MNKSIQIVSNQGMKCFVELVNLILTKTWIFGM